VDESGNGSAECGRGHADDGNIVTVQPGRPSEHAGIALKAALPEAVADNGDREGARLIGALLGQKRAAQLRFNSQDVEVVGRDKFGPGALGAPAAAHAQRSEPPDGQARNQLQIIAVIAVVEVGSGHQDLAGGGHGFDECQFARIVYAWEGVEPN
jgi:hypothetical protein